MSTSVDYNMKSCSIKEVVDRSSFCYVLCHTRRFKQVKVTKTASISASSLPNLKLFRDFLQSVFYVGKGTGRRRKSHLEGTKYLQMKSIGVKTSEKENRIREIWSANKGVMVIQGFHSQNDHKAHNKESAMISTIGKENLTNVRNAPQYGIIRNWEQAKIKNYGMWILYKLFCNFLEQPVKPLMEKMLRNVGKKKALKKSCNNYCKIPCKIK